MPRPSGAGGRRARRGRSQRAAAHRVGPDGAVQLVRGGAGDDVVVSGGLVVRAPLAAVDPDLVVLVAPRDRERVEPVVLVAPPQRERVERAVLVDDEHAAARCWMSLAGVIIHGGSPPWGDQAPGLVWKHRPGPPYVLGTCHITTGCRTTSSAVA